MTTARDGATDDRALVERLQARDPQALGRLYDRYGGALYAQLLRATGRRSVAEDLVQETFVRAWNRVREFDPASGPLEPWLQAIAREVAARWEDSDTPAVAPGAVPPPVSPKLRRRILASAGLERFGWAPSLGIALVLALSAAIYFGGRERTFAIEDEQLREQMRQQDIALTRFNNALSILGAEGTTASSFTSGRIHGTVFVNAAQGLLLIASNLTPAPKGGIYEMWLIGKDGKAAPAGLFPVRRDGTGFNVDRGQLNLPSIQSVAVTLENEGGAGQPGSPFLLTAPLPK